MRRLTYLTLTFIALLGAANPALVQTPPCLLLQDAVPRAIVSMMLTGSMPAADGLVYRRMR